jgi:hypothetical protein
MGEVMLISPVEQQLAELMVKYGPQWGYDVSPAVVAMAHAGQADDVRTTDTAAAGARRVTATAQSRTSMGGRGGGSDQ